MPALRFLPERTDFFVAFRAAGTNAADAARLLSDLVTGQEPADQAVVRLRDLEHRGDEITHEIFTALARNLIAPISFDDIRALARQLDDVTDAIDDVGQRLVLYHLLPATEVAHQLARIIQAQAESLAAAVALIAHGKHRGALERHVAEIHRLETEADAVVDEGLARLYDGVTAIPGFVSAMRWGELYGLLEETTDRAETVANTLQGIMEQQV
jgi:predicted phosphate transport protein (TIGR00153 family)